MKSMINKLSIFTVILTTVLTTGCSKTVEPTTVAKKLTPAGYTEEVYQPGKVWLWPRQSLVTLDVSTKVYEERVQVKIGENKNELGVDIQFRGRINAGNPQVLNAMFNDISAGDDRFVSFPEVYNTYGKMNVRRVAREVLSTYELDDVHANYSLIQTELQKGIGEALSSTPIQVSDITLGEVRYPASVTNAIEAAETRRQELAQIEATAKKDMLEAEKERLIAEERYKIEMIEARTLRDYNVTVSEGIDDKFLEYQRIQVQQTLAENASNGNSSTVFMPLEAMSSTGAQVRMFGN